MLLTSPDPILKNGTLTELRKLAESSSIQLAVSGISTDLAYSCSSFKETVSVISSDPSCKDVNARFTTVHLKALSDHEWIKYPCFCFFKKFKIFSFEVSLRKWLAHFLFIRSIVETHRNKYFSSQKNEGILTTFLIRLRFQGYRCKSGIECMEGHLKL